MALRQEVAVPKVESQRSANTANATVTVRTITTVGDEPGSETRHGEDVAASSHTPSRVGTPGSVEYDHPRSSTVPHRFFGLPGTIVRVEVRLVPASGSRLTGSGAIPKEMFSPGGTNATILAIRAGRRGGHGWPRQSPRDPGTHDATPA